MTFQATHFLQGHLLPVFLSTCVFSSGTAERSPQCVGSYTDAIPQAAKWDATFCLQKLQHTCTLVITLVTGS